VERGAALAVLAAAIALRHVSSVATLAAVDAAATAGDAVVPRPVVVWLIFLFAGVRLPEALMLLRLQDLGVTAAMIPMWWAALHVVRTAASYPGGWLSDHLGAPRTMVIGWIFHAGVAGGLAAASGPWAGGLSLLARLRPRAPSRRSGRSCRLGGWAGAGGASVCITPETAARATRGLALAPYQWAGGRAMRLSAALVLVLGVMGLRSRCAGRPEPGPLPSLAAEARVRP
jgi:hypothetical protein